jgi:hypothetical protein
MLFTYSDINHGIPKVIKMSPAKFHLTISVDFIETFHFCDLLRVCVIFRTLRQQWILGIYMLITVVQITWFQWFSVSFSAIEMIRYFIFILHRSPHGYGKFPPPPTNPPLIFHFICPFLDF